MFKQAAKEALILIGAAIAIAFSVYAIRADKLGPMHAAINPDVGQTSPTDAGFSEITIEDAARLHEEKSALFADARHASDYEAGHVEGAVNLYTAEQDAWLPAFLAATDPATLIITYCDGNECHLATELAELLFINGFERVHYLKNGWTRWREGGYPVE